MKEPYKTKQALTRELASLKKRITGLEKSESERKHAEEALRVLSVRNEAILSAVPDIIMEVDCRKRYTWANQAGMRFFGEDVIGRDAAYYFEGEQETYNKVQPLFDGEEDVIYVESWQRRKDGEKRLLSWWCKVLKDRQGLVSGALSTSRDITDRQQAEMALRASEKKYRSILESIEDGYFEVDLAGNMTLFNPAMCKIANMTAEELLGMNNREYTTPDTAKKMFSFFNEIYRTGQAGTLKEYEVIKKDGIRGNLELSASLIRDTEGNPIGFRGIVRDVTERKMWEDTLRRSEEKYRSILENIQEGYFEVNLAGKLTFFNDVLCNISGYSRDELLGMQNMEYLTSESATILQKVFSKVYRTGQPSSIVDYDVVTKDGKIVHAELSASLIKDKKGKPLGFRAVARNVTERKESEHALKESFERLHKSLGATIRAIAVTVETRDPYTAGHQRRVADLARSIATELNLSFNQIDGIRMAAAIHDLGKISVPVEILSKPTTLTKLELELIKTHVQSGYDILKDIEFPWPIARMVLEHHERTDGSGYPNGLIAEETLLESRILALADVVESVASDRPYRPSLGIDKALEEIEKNRDIFYDATVVDACLRLFREKGYKLQET